MAVELLLFGTSNAALYFANPALVNISRMKILLRYSFHVITHKILPSSRTVQQQGWPIVQCNCLSIFCVLRTQKKKNVPTAAKLECCDAAIGQPSDWAAPDYSNFS